MGKHKRQHSKRARNRDRGLGPCIELPSIFTDPGCDSEVHRSEVAGALMALAMRGPWPGKTLMDCGCLLWIVGAA